MPDQNEELKKCLDKLEQFVRDSLEIFPHPEELEQLSKKFQGTIPQADKWDVADGDLGKFEQFAHLLHECGTTTDSRGRQVADRVKAIIQGMENIDRSDADGMDVLREFLLRQQQATCKEDMRPL
ncbi:MAG: hypothetical protein Q9221_001348 [Calogaya cf. arnoldii]